MPRSSFERRAFLFAAGSASAAAAAKSGLTMARSRSLCSPPDDPEDMAAFARLVGLSFRPEERTQAARRLQRLRENYEQLRAAAIDFELPPAAHFDPRPPQLRANWPAASDRTSVAIPTDVAMPNDELGLAFASVLELASLLRQGKVTSRRLTELSLSRLATHDTTLHCVVNLLRDEALQRADAMDKELAAGKDRGPLHGIPYGAKDLFAWPSAPTTFGAAPFAEQIWDLRATCLDRLHAAGAVLCAKLSLGALAMGDLWHGGRTRNPWNPKQGSSGSSAGSAAAVAAGLVPFAIGTETLGSIVSPCTRCGVGGLRPTFGSVSRHGAMPLSWTMDKVGPIARAAIDQGIVFDAMRGADGKDPAARDTAFSWQPTDPSDQQPADIQQLRIGVLQQRRWPANDGDHAFLAWIERATGRAPKRIPMPDAPYAAMLLQLHAEAASAFDAFTRADLDDQLPGQDGNDWPNQFRSARTIPAVEYLRAGRLRSRLIQDLHQCLADLDVLIGPTHGTTLTATNLSGHPTMVLPVGESARPSDGGRPTMLALTGQLDGEGALLAVAQAWQLQTQWHRRRPAIASAAATGSNR